MIQKCFFLYSFYEWHIFWRPPETSAKQNHGLNGLFCIESDPMGGIFPSRQWISQIFTAPKKKETVKEVPRVL